MSIATELTNYQTYLTNAYTQLQKKNATIPQNKNLNNISTAIRSLKPNSVESKDVDFIDYDGTILYSYTAQEFQNLTELPPNPTHNGLNSQGWNWTLADAKTQVASAGFLDIGQSYITSDGFTKIKVKIEKETKDVNLSLKINGTANINWGDGTQEDTTTGTSTGTIQTTSHSYTNTGEYEIKIKPQTGAKIIIPGRNASPYFLLLYGSVQSATGVRAGIESIEIGDGIEGLEQYSLYKLKIDKINLPTNIKSIGARTFAYSNIETLIIPNNTSTLTLESYSFAYAQLCKRISIPKNTPGKTYLFSNMQSCNRLSLPSGCDWNLASEFVSMDKLERIALTKTINGSTGSSMFNQCQILKKIKMPKEVTSISGSTFANCYALNEIDLSDNEAVPTMTSSNYTTAFTNVMADCKIIVPDSLYTTWTTATTWSTISQQIVKKSEA